MSVDKPTTNDAPQAQHVCPCHENVDIDGLPCTREDEGLDRCNERGALNGTTHCSECGFKGTW